MNTPTDSRLAVLTAHLLVIHRAYRAAADKALADYGLSQATAWPVISAGRLGDGVRQGVLAEAMGVEGPSLVRVLDQLVAQGLIERREDPVDRRAKTLHLTAAGHALREQVEAMLVELRRRLFVDVDEADLEACIRVFDSLKSTLARSPVVEAAFRAAPRMPAPADEASTASASTAAAPKGAAHTDPARADATPTDPQAKDPS